MPTRNQFRTVSDFREALRDWFAGQALQGILACPIDHKGDKDEYTRTKTAWLYADRMMAAWAQYMASVPALQGWHYHPISDTSCRAIYAKLEPHGA